MAIEIKAPTYPESVQEGTLATWHKNVGDSVTRDELLVDIETDKAAMEVESPATGYLHQIAARAGDKVAVGTTIAMLDPSVAICCVTETCAPLPTATANITEKTPIITPSVVSIERIKLVRSAVIAIAIFTPQPATALKRLVIRQLPAGAI